MAQVLQVFVAGEYAGNLIQDAPGERPSFAYAPTYVASSETPLSVRLPLREQTHPPKAVEPYLAGLLPENDQTRARWAERAWVHPGDLFGLLRHMGLDCPGAVQFCASDDLDALTARSEAYVVRSDAEVAQRLRDLARDEASWSMPEEHWSLGGQQEKFALALLEGRWHEAHGSAATTHIIKPGIKAVHHQALIEHATQVVAGQLGVLVAPTAFTAFEDQWAIVSTRYDRLLEGSRVTRLHQEDFCQAVGRMPSAKHEVRGGPGLRDLVAVTDRFAADRGAARRALADFLIINVVAGAPDGHAKNVSLLHAAAGLEVAPLYDLATGLAYDKTHVERTAALSVGGVREYSKIYAKQWEKAAGVLKLAADGVKARVAELAERFPVTFLEVVTDMVTQGVPGSGEVLERSLAPVLGHCEGVLSRLG